MIIHINTIIIMITIYRHTTLNLLHLFKYEIGVDCSIDNDKNIEDCKYESKELMKQAKNGSYEDR